MSAKCRHWAMDKSPKASDFSRQQSRILVFRLHDHAISLKTLEVFCECK